MKSIEVHSSIVFEDGVNTYYPRDPGINEGLFKILMGLNTEEVIRAFNKGITIDFVYEYNEKTSLEDLYSQVQHEYGFRKKLRYVEYAYYGNNLYLLCQRKLIRVDNKKYKLLDFIKAFNSGRSLDVLLFFWSGAGDLWRGDGIRIYIPSREKCKHKEPHIHAEFQHNQNVSLSIKNGEILAGIMKPKKLKIVREILDKNRESFLEFWNYNTDGLNVDIDYYLGRTRIEHDCSEVERY